MNLLVRSITLLLVSASLGALSPANVRANPSQNDLRKAIQTMLGSSLPSNAVQVREVRTTKEGTAEVSAEIQAVFRARQVDGRWRLSEIRTAPDRWEPLDLIAQALHASLPAGDCDEPSQFVRSASPAALTMKRARCLVAELLGVTLPSDLVRIKDMSLLDLPFGSESSALIEAFIQADFRVARDARGWHVSEVKTGNREWTNIENFGAALNEVKRANATADLAAIANALIEFRRERGAFVVSDKESVLIDHLSPRYLTRVIRVDPWHRPYEYEGEQNQFSLRSVGPDGKTGTPDDIVVSGPR
ncbi:MAG: type II secretion system protein GspG [Pyrinomonadaceae bacterium]